MAPTHLVTTGIFIDVASHVAGTVCLEPPKPAPSRPSTNRTLAQPCPRRRRSRVDGCPFDHSPRAEILIPAP